MRARRTVLAVLAGLIGGGLVAERGVAQGAVLAPRAEPTIRVAGVGEVEVRPDEAEIDFAVETFAQTARAAAEENARVMERVIQALVRAGIPRERIETRGYSVFPEYVHDEARQEPRLRGYRVTNRVAVETQDLARVGPLIDVALQAGANRVEGVQFRVRDPAVPRAAALREAVARARAEAQTLADALGVRLGPLMDASTTYEPVGPIPVMMERGGPAMAEMDVAALRVPPIQPGEQTVRASVFLVYSIAGGR